MNASVNELKEKIIMKNRIISHFWPKQEAESHPDLLSHS